MGHRNQAAVEWFPFFSIFTISRELCMEQERSLRVIKKLIIRTRPQYPDKFANGLFTLHRIFFRFVIEESRAGKKLCFKMFSVNTKTKRRAGIFTFLQCNYPCFFLLFFLFLSLRCFSLFVKLIIFTFSSV